MNKGPFLIKLGEKPEYLYGYIKQRPYAHYSPPVYTSSYLFAVNGIWSWKYFVIQEISICEYPCNCLP